MRNIYRIGNRKLQNEIEFAYKKFKNSKQTMEKYFGVRIIKAMKRYSDEYVIKTKKIDTNALIIFGDNKHKDDYYLGKDFINLKSFEPIAIELNLLLKLHGHQPINNLENEYFGKFNIYHLKEVKDKHSKKRTVGFKSREVPLGENGSINIGVYDWPTTDVYWLPSQNLINNAYMCTKSAKCFYTCTHRRDMDKHEKRCKNVQEVISQQLEYGSQSDHVSKLSEIMDIDFSNFRQKHFCTYDIETFGKKEVCIPVSIAVSSTLEGPRYFEKADDTPEATHQMVSDFLDYLLELQQKLLDNLEPEIEQAILYLQAEKEETFNPRKYKSKYELNSLYNYFKNYEVLKTYGFNSRFVNNVKVYLYTIYCLL